MTKRDTSKSDSAHSRSESARDAIRDRFRSQVTASLEAGLVRYSRRRELLRLAERMGVAQFEASLIIAEVQYGDQRPNTPTVDASSAAQQASALRRTLRVAALRRSVVIVSLLALVIIWYLLH